MMKQIVFLFTVMLLAASCERSDTAPDFLRIGDKKANLYDAFFFDDGTNENDITYRRIAVQLVDNDFDPSYFIQFLICSHSTRELVEGSYTYGFNEQRGVFTYLKAGAALRRDYDGYYISGEVYDDDDGVEVLDGYLDVSKDKSRHVFEFFITVVKNTDTIDIEGYYNGYMKEQVFDIYEQDEF
ncbi:MAG: hypothetical protein GVY19_04520 [Bacteroidetes bacterium]|jgi:hypothetical protein|nr:hypothetical protein [Bacteroidota bacterium]